MDSLSVLRNALGAIWWLIPLVLVAGAFRTPRVKGMVGEFLVKLAARVGLPADGYHAFHDVTLPTPDGGTTQIDHVFVSRFGIFVVETKHMKGWIFGGEHQPRWTQRIYRKTVSFQNPLQQNRKHVKALEALLDLPENAIHSVVVFTGDCRFKTPMPTNVIRGSGYLRYIRAFETPVLDDAQVRDTIAAIASGRLAPTRATHRRHVAYLKARSDPDAERKCPQCGSKMVLRTVKRGANPGKRFWGCSTFPGCRGSRDAE